MSNIDTVHKKRLFGNFFSLTILQMVNYALPLLTLPYLVRVLDVETYGLVMFAQSFILFFNILVDFGFNLSATKDVAIYRDNKEKLTEVYSSVMIIKCLLILVSFVLLTVIIHLSERFSETKFVYYLSFLWVVGQALFPIWYFQGIEKMKYITIVNIVSKVLFTGCIFIFVNENSDYLLVPLFNGVGLVIAALIALWIIHVSLKQTISWQKPATLWFYFKQSSTFFLSRASLSMYTSANSFVLGLFSSNSVVGYYAIADQLYKALQAFYTPLSQVLYPYIAKERNISLFKKIFKVSVILNVVGIFILFFIIKDVFEILFTQKIGMESIVVFNIFLIASLIVVPSILLGYPFLGALGYSKEANMSVIYASILHIAGLVVLILLNQITLYSVAYMVLITESFVFIYRIMKIRGNKLWQKQL
ncbi:RfbX protein [Actinobacillus succinogenes]|uniref:Polysaccharide biosynthesis protein n=1 Tax=Actinobacillus succinogenes (strain ATCC 55618 / DSM 22257 / CCUG 43843 / 130Z) TaxID=339671 RepID=A6VMI8_ACTSZ|nr:oligosaccharide flippase family protein [Actinobacillus succinogenes]ABR74185.1 polysaccharide biosynthesis protein [Actinobacillus succinogenes 130Z]PHI39385.1 RfbX protein [Actinobacillus succinogenes]